MYEFINYKFQQQILKSELQQKYTEIDFSYSSEGGVCKMGFEEEMWRFDIHYFQINVHKNNAQHFSLTC